MLLGITGTDGAGKNTVVDYIVKKKGFVHYPARQLFIEEIEQQGLEVNRANMRIVANELRRAHGDDFLITTYLKRKEEEGVEDAIIESIRAKAEAAALKAAGGVLLCVDADQKLRYKRIQSRASESDQVSFEEFKKHEKLEMNDPDPHGMQKAAVIAMADYTITNDGSLEELHARIDELLVYIGDERE